MSGVAPSPPAGPADAIDAIAGLAPDSPASALRARRPELTRYAQACYGALLEREAPTGLTRREREAVALRVATLTPHPALAEWHRARLRGLGAAEAGVAAIVDFPNGSGLSPRETAILRHTDLLTTDPEGAERADIELLKEEGLSTVEIVTLSQLIGFLSFQVRVLHGLRLLAETA